MQPVVTRTRIRWLGAGFFVIWIVVAALLIARQVVMPVESPFSARRNPVVDSANPALLMPEFVGQAKRSGKVGSTLEAMYTLPDGSTIDFSASRVTPDDVDVLWGRRTLTCGYRMDSSVQEFRDQPIPHWYEECSNAFPGAAFHWLNGKWLFSASSDNLKALLTFVNAYPY